MSTRANADKYRWTTSGLESYLSPGVTAQNPGVVPQQRSGILDLIGTLTNASKLEGGQQMDQWGNPIMADFKPANPFWDHLLTNAQGARKAESMNNARAQLEQGLKMLQLQHSLELEKENLKSGNTIREKKVDSRLKRRGERQTEEERRKTLAQVNDLGIAGKEGITSTGLPDFAGRVNPIRTRNAVSGSLNEGLQSESTGRLLRGQRTALDPDIESSMKIGLIAQALGVAPKAFSELQVRAGQGDVIGFPNLNNLPGGYNMLQGPQINMQESSTKGGMEYTPEGKPRFLGDQQSRIQSFNPYQYIPAPQVNPAKVLQGQQEAQKRLGEINMEQQEAPPVPFTPPNFGASAGFNLGGGSMPTPTAEIPPALAALIPLLTGGTNIASKGFGGRAGAVVPANIPTKTVSDVDLGNLPNNALSAILNFYNMVSGNENRRAYK